MIGFKTRQELKDALDTKPQTTIFRFSGFTNAIDSMVNDHIDKSKNITVGNAIGLAYEDLLQSIKIQEDVHLSNSLHLKVEAV